MIHLDAADKGWLGARARIRDPSLTRLLRAAIRCHRACEEARGHPRLAAALRDGAGIWRHGDGLHRQRRLREARDRRV